MASGRVDINPVRAKMVGNPGDYKWSSYQQRMGLEAHCWIDLDPNYLGLAATEAARRETYNRFIHDAIPDGEWKFIRDALQDGQ